MPNQIRYYLKETTNQILVSGSADSIEMNVLITANKDPNTVFDANTTAKISALGTAVSYVVQNGTSDGTVIPIADNQELWVYRGYQPTNVGDANAYKYNPHLHRPYKAYILTETGSGVPSQPWLPVGRPYEGSYTSNSPLTPQSFDQGFNARQLGINGNWINQFTNSQINVNPISGSFTVYGENRGVHPWVFTKYLSQNGSTIYGAEVSIFRESPGPRTLIGSISQAQFFTVNQTPALYPQITLTNGTYSYTSSNFDSITSTNGAASGSTQFGLYCDYDNYVTYKTTLDASNPNPVTIFFTGSNYTPQFITLPPGFNVKYTALVGSIVYDGGFSQSTLSTIIGSNSAVGTPPQDLFSTRWKDVYISFSSSLSSSIDGLYIFNQLPQNDIQVTASMFLNAWTGSDDGAKYGAADYGVDVYGAGEAGDGPTWPTASLRIYTGSFPDNVPNMGSAFVTESVFRDANIYINGLAITMSYLIPSESIQLKDCLSIALAVTSSQNLNLITSSLVVSEYSLRFFTPTQSREGDGRVPTFVENAFEGTLGFSNTPDCQPTLNNAYVIRPNNLIQEVDYSTNIYTPINFQAILSGSAQKSTVPESNYSSIAWNFNRYEGSKIQANNINSVEGLLGNFGTIPVIDYKRAYFAYCDQVIDLYPVINNKTLFNIKYLINEGGDALQPNLSPYTAFDVVGTWDEGGIGRVGINQISGSTQFDQLNNLQSIYKVAKLPQPILYSQTGATSYASLATNQSIPLAGNPNRISSFNPLYCQYGMSFIGSAYNIQNDNDKVVLLSNIASNITDPDNALTTSSIYKPAFGYSGSGDITKFIESSIITGSTSGLPGPDTYGNTYVGLPGQAYFTTDPFTANTPGLTGDSLSDNYKFKMKFTQPSTPPYEYRTRNPSFWQSSRDNETNVGQIYFYLQKSTNGVNWTDCPQQIIESPKLICYWQGGQSEILDLSLILGSNNAGLRTNNLLMYIEINPKLIKNAIAQRGKNYADIIYVNFVIYNQNADSEQLIANTQYRWRADLRYDDEPLDKPRNYWNPTSRPAIGGSTPIFPPVKGPFINAAIQGTQPVREGSDDAINSPYWAFSQSGVFDLIQLEDENGNASYNEGYFQGYLPYTASVNTAFPGGLEPADTAFPLSNIQWNVEVNDEIRFENNESKVFKVTEVIPPGESSNGKLKLKLDGNIPPSTNKDFFLLRRYVYSPNSIVVDQLFPYGALPTTKEFIPSVNTYTENGPLVSLTQNYPTASISTQEQSGSFVTTYAPLTKLANTPSGILYPEYPTDLIDLETDNVINTLRNNKLIT